MKIEVITGVVGRDFAFSPGEIVDQDEFALKVGTGWNALCAPHSIVETQVKRQPKEIAVKRRASR